MTQQESQNRDANLFAIWKHLATNEVKTVEAAFFSSP